MSWQHALELLCAAFAVFGLAVGCKRVPRNRRRPWQPRRRDLFVPHSRLDEDPRSSIVQMRYHLKH